MVVEPRGTMPIRGDATLQSNARVIAVCLIGVVVSLILVGIVSGTLLRHVVQVIPPLVALWLLLRKPETGAYAVATIFAFWALVMALIWLYLLGLSDIAYGSYSAIEIILTVVIAACSLLGIAMSLRVGRPLSLLRLAATVILFLALQIAFMAASFEHVLQSF